MNLSAPFIYRPVMTTFVMLTIFLAGWISFLHLPVSDLPTVEHPELEIVAGYVGANADTVLNLVTIPLEKELANVKGVEEISSVSSFGQSSISLKFDLNQDMDKAIRDVQAAINRAESRLPSGLLPRPYYTRQQGSQEPIMYMLLVSNSVSLGDLREYADTYIIPRLSRIEGVAKVNAFGNKKSVWIKVNPELMAARDIGFNQVAESVSRFTSKAPIGSIKTSSKTLALELSGEVFDASQLENIDIDQTGVKLKDIADVLSHNPDNVDFYFVTPTHRSLALALGVQKVSDANTVHVSEEIKKALKQIQTELPPTVELKLWFDKAVWIHESILDVEWSLLFAFALVVLVIYLSLGRLSEALIPSVALPLSLVGTFIAMYALDFSLDLLSLLALTLSVGFVVDDAIVVLENIVRHQEKGEDNFSASLNGSKQICFTILSMTISLVAVFIPLLFMPGMAGRLFREFSITLSISILISGFISLSLIPMLCAYFLPKRTKHTKLEKKVTEAHDWMVDVYGKTLRVCLKYSKTTLCVAMFCILATVPLFMKLPVKLVPDEDRGFMFSFISLPAGLPKEDVKHYQLKLEAIFQKNPAIESFLDLYHGSHLIFVVRLKSITERAAQDAVVAQLKKELDDIPGIMAFNQSYNLINLDLEMGAGGQYQYIVKGLTFDEVDVAAGQLVKALQAHPSFDFVQPPQKNDSPKLVLHINEDKANQLGLTKQSLQNLLQQIFGQNEIAILRDGSREKKVYLELQKSFQSDVDVLSKLYLAPSLGELVALKTVVSWEEQLGSPSRVQREQLPAVSVGFSLKDSIAPQDGLKVVEEIAKKTLPADVLGSFSGAAMAVSNTMNHTLLLLLAAAGVMYVVLGILYESFIHPLTILSSLPFAGLGGVLTLQLFDEPLSIFSAVGFLLLIGIVKKNGIMMIDYALENQKKGMRPEKAIFEGCMVRFRPIMMTTIAAIMGAIPIAIGFGDGAEIRRGLGLVIVGGLLFSQLLTLYVTPVIYLTLENTLRRKKTCKEDVLNPQIYP